MFWITLVLLPVSPRVAVFSFVGFSLKDWLKGNLLSRDASLPMRDDFSNAEFLFPPPIQVAIPDAVESIFPGIDAHLTHYLSPPTPDQPQFYLVAVVSPSLICAWHALCWFGLNYWFAFVTSSVALTKACTEIRAVHRGLVAPLSWDQYARCLFSAVAFSRLPEFAANGVIVPLLIMGALSTLLEPIRHFWRAASKFEVHEDSGKSSLDEAKRMRQEWAMGLTKASLVVLPLVFDDDYMQDALVYIVVMPLLVMLILWAKYWTVTVLASHIKAENTHYTMLGVSETATISEIKKGFKRMALKWHPDKNSSAEAEATMKQVNEAYEVLKDEDSRKVYDDESTSRKSQQEFANVEQANIELAEHLAAEGGWAPGNARLVAVAVQLLSLLLDTNIDTGVASTTAA